MNLLIKTAAMLSALFSINLAATPENLGGLDLSYKSTVEKPLRISAKSSRAALPAAVDNSTSKAFRPVFTQKGESCVHASSVSYIFTYEMNAYRGTDASLAENQYPYAYRYNFMDGESGRMTSPDTIAFETLKRMGVPSVATYGYFDIESSDETYYNQFFKHWATGYPLYKEAMVNSIEGYWSHGNSTPGGAFENLTVEDIKQWMFDHGDGDTIGGVVYMSATVGGENFSTISYPPSQTGEVAWADMGASFGHAMTLAGYNDSIVTGVDTGAFLLVNSWGEDWGVKGKAWVPYREIMAKAIFIQGCSIKKEYEPEVVINVSFTSSQRNGLKFTVGISTDLEATTPSVTTDFCTAFNYNGGSLPMQGFSGGSDLEASFDITSLVNNIIINPNDAVKLFITLNGVNYGDKIITSASIEDYRTGSLIETLFDDMPMAVEIDVSNGWANNIPETRSAVSGDGTTVVKSVANRLSQTQMKIVDNNLFFSAPQSGSYQCSVTSLSGRQILSFATQVSVGMNRISLGNSLSRGVYLVTVRGADLNQSIKALVR